MLEKKRARKCKQKSNFVGGGGGKDKNGNKSGSRPNEGLLASCRRACQWLMIIQLRRNPVIRLNTDAWLEAVVQTRCPSSLRTACTHEKYTFILVIQLDLVKCGLFICSFEDRFSSLFVWVTFLTNSDPWIPKPKTKPNFVYITVTFLWYLQFFSVFWSLNGQNCKYQDYK